jgi:8-oxo-dGTP diphosphatase
MSAGQRYQWPRANLAVDVVVFTIMGGRLHVALVRRKSDSPAFPGAWALPGGFLRCGPELNETVEECAARELLEETGMQGEVLEQFGVYSALDRDPRERVVSIAFTALIPADRHRLEPAPGSDALEVKWVALDDFADMQLAFDHRRILDDARERLKGKISFGRDQQTWRDDAVLLSGLLPNPFTVADAVEIVSAVKGDGFDVPNFRRWFLDERKWLIEKALPPAIPRETPGRKPSKRPPAYYARDGIDRIARRSMAHGSSRERLDVALKDPMLRAVPGVEAFLESTLTGPEEALSFASELLARLTHVPLIELRVVRPADLHIRRTDGSGFVLTVRWNPGAMTLTCRTNLAPSTLRRIMPFRIVDRFLTNISTGSFVEFELEAYKSCIPLLERLIAVACSTE